VKPLFAKIYGLLIAALLVSGHCALAQDNADAITYGGYHNNFQIYTSVKINKDFKYGFSANAQYLLRTDVTNRTIDGHYFYASLKYKPLKFLFFDFQFRGVNTIERNLYRFEFGIKPRYKYKDWTFAFRTAYFNEREYFARTYEHGRYPNNYWRNRLEVRWDFKKNWGAYASAEVYTLFTNRDVNARRMAFIAGADYTFFKMNNVNIYYMAQPDFNQKSPNLVQAVALVYTFDIPKKFKKKKKKHD
jgi:hypothetical protein